MLGHLDFPLKHGGTLKEVLKLPAKCQNCVSEMEADRQSGSCANKSEKSLRKAELRQEAQKPRVRALESDCLSTSCLFDPEQMTQRLWLQFPPL